MSLIWAEKAATSKRFSGAAGCRGVRAGTSRIAALDSRRRRLAELACALRQPFLLQFKKKALLDVDPGHLQISASQADLDLDYHDVFLTVGNRINAADSIIPKLGHHWHVFDQLIYLPLWDN